MDKAEGRIAEKIGSKLSLAAVGGYSRASGRGLEEAGADENSTIAASWLDPKAMSNDTSTLEPVRSDEKFGTIVRRVDLWK